MTIQESQGIQFKEGSYTFPPHFKCRVDVKAIKGIPRILSKCKQGIRVLNDLFYEVSAEEKEGITVQKAIWENMLERILDMRVFNSTSAYTDLSNQILPVKVILPSNKQYYPVEHILTKEPTNPFRETKIFARELLAIVTAIKTIREEKHFNYKDFFIYPNADAFTVTDSEDGKRYLAVAIHSVAPADIDENLSSEDLCVAAIKDLVQKRWDRREFRKVLNAPDLNTIFQVLKKLSQDVPTWKMVAIKSAYAAIYVITAFIAFSILMFLTGLTPWNKAVLENLSLYFVDDQGKIISHISSLPIVTTSDEEDKNREAKLKYIRIIMEAKKKSKDLIQVVGTYRSPFRLEKMGGLLIFNLLGVTTTLDKLYHLNYNSPLKLGQFKYDHELKLVEVVEAKDEYTFRLKAHKKWGRERFKIVPKVVTQKQEKSKNIPVLAIEALVIKPRWTLEMNPSAISFQQAQAGEEAISTDAINIYANPPEEMRKRGEKIVDANLRSYFTVDFNRIGIPIQIHYLDPKGIPVAKIIFDNFEEGKLKSPPKLRSIRIKGMKRKRVEEYEEDEGYREDEEDTGKKPKRLPKVKEIDTFVLQRDDSFAQIALKEGIITREQYNECYKIWKNKIGLEIKDILINKKYVNKAQVKEILEKAKTKYKDIKKNVIKDVYYRLPKLPQNINTMKIVVLSRYLPNDEVRGDLHIAVPGIIKPLSVPITFHPKQKVEFSPKKIEDIRDKVTGVALPIHIKKRVWGELVKFNLHELRYFTFCLKIQPNTPHLKNFAPLGLGLQLKGDPNTIYFYNPATGDTYSIVEYSRKGGKIYFTAKEETYKKWRENFFEVPSNKKQCEFRIKEAVAKETTQLYIMVLTDKNVENAELIIKWRGGETAAQLPISARSREALRIVRWKPDTSGRKIKRYTKKDWIENIAVEGPLGFERYQAIIFSGEEPDKDVSDKVYIYIPDLNKLNILYQTVDGDWFSNIKEKFNSIKVLNNPKSQLSIKKFKKDKEKGLKIAYFRAEQKEIGRVNKYLIVPGRGVKPGEKEFTTQIKFYYPEKDMEAVLNVKVSCKKAPKVDWQVKLDNKEKIFKVKVFNYPKDNARKLFDTLKFLTTCASISLLHNQYHRDWKANNDDKRWAETIKWSLESIGFHKPPIPPDVLGKLGGAIGSAIKNNDQNGIRTAYQITREALLLAWSKETQTLLTHHLGLNEIYNGLIEGKNIRNKRFELKVKLQPKRVLPPLVDEPERFIEVELDIPYDKLLLDKKDDDVFQLCDSYYYGIPKDFDSAPEVKELLSSIYPYPKDFPKQTNIVPGSEIKISNMLYPNLLQYSLWAERVNNFNKKENKFWIAMLGVTADIASLDGKIDKKEVNKIAEEIQRQLKTYFLTPINVRRVYWSEIKEKIRGEAEKNRDMIGKEEKEGLLRFVERSMMAQFTDTQCWYTNFTFVIDRLMLDRCPFHKWIYIKTTRPTIEGFEGEEVKLRIFKRDGFSLSPYPGQEYSVDIWSDPTGYTRLVTVKGITVFQNWFAPHTSREVKASKVLKRLRVKFYYEEGGEEKVLKRPGRGGPPIIDFEVHPAAVILFEVSGYHLSIDKVRQLVRKKKFTIRTTKGKTRWLWTFSFDNGPVVVPFAYHIIKRPDTVLSYSVHILNWKQDPPPALDQRNLEALAKNYDMEFLYIDTKAKLPWPDFFPYKTLEDICKDYDKGSISSERMIDLLNKLFELGDKLPHTTKFKWNKDLTEYYKTYKNEYQMFRYNYDNNHQLTITVPAYFEKPKDFKGKDHPKLQSPPGYNMAVIWKIMPANTTNIYQLRGFPKYIMEKKFFPNSEPVFSKE